MSIVKSFSVGNGDMFAIRHNSDNFTVIDCCICDENKDRIFSDLEEMRQGKGIERFISTHPDKDHIQGLQIFKERLGIPNFYCVKNNANKKDEDSDFTFYTELRDWEKAFYIKKGCNRRWMNLDDEVRKSAGINILWPDMNDEYFKAELEGVEDCKSPNNISPIILYEECGFKFMWMGDLTNEFMEKLDINKLGLVKVDVLFAPHHGRCSGKVPNAWLEKLNPLLIIIGEGPSNCLYYDYAKTYNTITQNSAGDITFDIQANKIKIYVSNNSYSTKTVQGEEINADYEISEQISDIDIAGYYLASITRGSK